MKLFLGSLVLSGILSAAALHAASSLAQPLKSLNNVYGNAAEISEGVANGSYRGLDVSQQDINSSINQLPHDEMRAELKSLQEIYGGLDQFSY